MISRLFSTSATDLQIQISKSLSPFYDSPPLIVFHAGFNGSFTIRRFINNEGGKIELVFWQESQTRLESEEAALRDASLSELEDFEPRRVIEEIRLI